MKTYLLSANENSCEVYYNNVSQSVKFTESFLPIHSFGPFKVKKITPA